MDIALISRISLEYHLHNGKHWKTLIIDLSNACNSPRRVKLDTIRHGGLEIFDAIARDCSFFQFYVRAKVAAGKSDALAHSTTVVTVEMAAQLDLVRNIHQQLIEKCLGIACVVAQELCDKQPSAVS